MYKRQLSNFVIFWAVLSTLFGNSETSPTKRLSRMVREVYPEIEPENEGNQAQVCIVGDVVYGGDEPVPAEQPCLKCRCQPPGVQCETIQCVKKPGCKAIHKSNKCCPEYQCECEHNGKIYANGEKLETPPGGECKVCYCRGGEVQCAEVSCYIRKDCEGKRVTGKCCPKYDHCPPIDPVPGRSSYTTELNSLNLDKESFVSWPVTRLTQNITEDILGSTSVDIQDENKIPDTNYFEATTPSYMLTEVELQKESFVPKITIQEIIPERKEIPITAPPKVELEPHGTLIIEEAEEFLNHSNDLVVTDADADSSEISEVFQHPPPVLRIGDKLLFLKKGEFVPEKDTSTPNSVITIIGAEGLQRGGFEESGEVHEVGIENILKETDPVSVATVPEKTEDLTSERNTFASSPDQELNTAESTHILSLVKKKNKPFTTTIRTSTTTIEAYTTTSTTESDIVSPTTETAATEDVPSPTTLPDVVNEVPESTDLPKTTVDTLDTLTTEEVKNTTEATSSSTEVTTQAKESTPVATSTRIYDIILEQNPAYPPIPEIMAVNSDDTSQRFDTDHTEKDTNTIEEAVTPTLEAKILPEVLEIRSNKTVPKNTTHSEWLKLNSETLINYQAALPEEILNEPASTDVEDQTETPTEVSVISETTTEAAATITNEATDFTTELVTDSDVKFETIIITSTDSSAVEDDRSTETMEEQSEETREVTTKKNEQITITQENASIEKAAEDSSEAGDMSSSRDTTNNNSGEETTPPALEDSGVIDKEWSDVKNSSKGNDDVEFVDAIKTKKSVIERNVEAEDLPVREKIVLPQKSINKRETSAAQGDVFEQLNKETSEEVSERSLSSEEEEKQSEEIFKQLLEDTSTAKARAREAESIESLLSKFAKAAQSQEAPLVRDYFSRFGPRL